MGKFDALLKAIGITAKDVGDDAVKALKEVKTAEVATGLKGKARSQYLEALDTVYGDQAARRKDMGFDSKDWYHGTKSDFNSFDPKKTGQNFTWYDLNNKGTYLASNPKTASSYAGTLDNDIYKKLADKESAMNYDKELRAYSVQKEYATEAQNLLKEKLKKEFIENPELFEKQKQLNPKEIESILSFREMFGEFFGDTSKGISEDDLAASLASSRFSNLNTDKAKRELINSTLLDLDKNKAKIYQEKLAKADANQKLGAELYNQAEKEASEMGQNVLPLKIKSQNLPKVKVNKNADSFDKASDPLLKLANDKDAIEQGGYVVENYTSPLQDQSAREFKNLKTDVAFLSDPSSIRSKFAAFDPRFKDSSLLMAGAGAIPMTGGADINPLTYLKDISNYYEGLKEKAADLAAKQFNIAGAAPEIEKPISKALSIGADPINFISGPVGLGLSTIQGAASLLPENEYKMRALERLKNK
jgi:hypothetical protein